eukprot:13296854-Heterocapsa_arctica.AAC.1
MLARIAERLGLSSGGPQPPPCKWEMTSAACTVVRGQSGEPRTLPMVCMAGRKAQGAHLPVLIMVEETLQSRAMSPEVGSAVFAG